MAAPAFVARSTNFAGNATSITGSAPAGSGGWLVAFLARNDADAVTSIPAGWVNTGLAYSDASPHRVDVYTFDATAGDPSDFVWSYAPNSAIGQRLTIVRYSGTSGLDGAPVASGDQDGAQLNHPGITTNGPDRRLLWVSCIRTNNVTTTPPGTMVERCDDTSAGSRGIAVADEEQASAGASGARNGSKGGVSNDAVVVMLALAPPVSGAKEAQRRLLGGVG